MGLMQLLTVGRSLGRIHDQPSRYKMSQQSLLPKFGSVSASEDQMRGISGTTNQALAKTDVEQSPSISASAPIDKKSMNAIQSVKPELKAASVPVSRPAFPRGRWTLFRNPFSRAAKPEIAKSPVQPDLLLDMVKPVRNDLNDADLELVQAARRAQAQVTEHPASEPSGVDGPAWSRIKNQFFGAGKA